MTSMAYKVAGVVSGLTMLAGFAACQPSGAQQIPAPPGPSDKDIASAYHPGYAPAAGNRSECLGRLMFEVPDKPHFEWGLPKRVRTNEEILGFSRILRGDQDNIHVGEVAIVVAAEANLKTIQEMQRSGPD